MKNLKRISVLTVVLAMTFMLCACSAYSGIESRMKKAGYEVASGESTETKTVTAAVDSMQLDCTVHIFSKKYEGALADVSSFAVVLEFESNDELEKALNEKIENSATLKGFIQDMEKSSYVNGNCILIPIPIGTLSTPAADILNEMTKALKG